ncbi:olfactory receptor 5M5-like [Candoia aspera]|uniref:olfactory receptor 5M5-like n=1 Tax=Candoia aspera TaxID=51853 RepID=UPI002FD7D352
MNEKNQSQVAQFIFSGFTNYPKLQVVLFAMFLIIYIITLSANLGMILLIKMDPQLHTPMYFFLSHLAFLDASYSSTVTPKAIADFFPKKKTISFIGCAIQFYMFDGLVMTELFLLSVMAYDRYVAICNPLLYSVVMSKRLCTVLVTSVYVYGFVSSVVQTALTFTLSFCQSNVINHFYCNDPPLLALSCSDTRPKEYMVGQNQTQVTGFTFSGFTDHPELQVVLFNVFLVIYIITLSANLGMILLIKMDPQLQTPMYFFLSHLAFLDASYSTSVTPKAMADFLAEKKSISWTGCVIQFFMFVALVTTELFLLSVMAYDRYVAICHPLLYSTIMSKKSCVSLVVGIYGYGFVNSMIQTSLTFQLSFCGPNLINHFYCNDPPLLALSCSDTRPKEIQLFALSAINLTGSLFTVIISYIYILNAIFGKHSTSRRHKAFSTCASHLIAIVIFYGTLFFMYVQPSSSHYLNYDKVISVFYAVVIPMLNPLIYVLRNKEVKGALRRMKVKKLFS